MSDAAAAAIGGAGGGGAQLNNDPLGNVTDGAASAGGGRVRSRKPSKDKERAAAR